MDTPKPTNENNNLTSIHTGQSLVNFSMIPKTVNQNNTQSLDALINRMQVNHNQMNLLLHNNQIILIHKNSVCKNQACKNLYYKNPVYKNLTYKKL